MSYELSSRIAELTATIADLRAQLDAARGELEAERKDHDWRKRDFVELTDRFVRMQERAEKAEERAARWKACAKRWRKRAAETLALLGRGVEIFDGDDKRVKELEASLAAAVAERDEAREKIDAPNVTFSDHGDGPRAVFEWWFGDRKITVYTGAISLDVVKVDGPTVLDKETVVTTPQEWNDVWAWLSGGRKL